MSTRQPHGDPHRQAPGHSQGHSHGHDHAGTGPGGARSLAITLALVCIVLLAEVIGGMLSGSLALLSDAAHMMTDAVALAIALAALRITRRPADELRSFGYHRFEILAALLLAGAAVYILVEAWRRLQQPPEIASSLDAVDRRAGTGGQPGRHATAGRAAG